MFRRVPLTILTVGLVAATTASASAGTMKFKRSCYIFGEDMSGLATGFLPNSSVKINSDKSWLDNQTLKADANGKVGLALLAPDAPAGLGKTSVIRKTVRLSDPRHRSRHARVTVRFSNVLADPGKEPDPRVRRTWQFVGFRGSGALYGHFVYGGKLVSSYAFGKPQGPCGRLKAKAAGLPVPRSKLRAGDWAVQFDRSRSYVPSGPDSLTLQLKVPRAYSTGK
jgi:hypothetical protein